MASSQMSEVIQHLRRAVLLRDGAGRTDGQLLVDYIRHRDGPALAALVRRHGPMVWGVCRRVLGNWHDAEDAFQATFLVLVRKAASLASPELVANWLYGVAHQTALKARATAAKRKTRESQVTPMPEPAVTEQDLWDDLLPLLDQELSGLPSKYRSVIVLCDLEGQTRKDAARQLGCPEGTVAGRLARARAMLAKQLTKRGVALSGGAVAAVLAQQAVSAGVPNSVVDATIKAARLLAAGKAAATGAISAGAAALTEGVMKAMLFTKLRAAIAVVLIISFVAAVATILTCPTAAGQDDKKPAAENAVEPAAKQEKEKESFTAWGKEIGGLQAGLGYPHGQRRTYYTGETVKLVVRVRNVSKDAVKFQYFPLFITQTGPTVVDGGGKVVQFRYGVLDTAIVHEPKDVTLAPGKEIVLGEVELLTTLLGTGRFTVQYERVFGKTYQAIVELDPTLSKLATGKLEVEIKSDPPPASGKETRQPEKSKEDLLPRGPYTTGPTGPDIAPQKVAFTAWGKEIGGLQAGLGFRPGEKRPYHHGEEAWIVLRLRNIGKEALEFSHIWAFFVENPPTITDADGKILQLPKLHALGLQAPRNTPIAPGKEVVLYEWNCGLQPIGGISKNLFTIHGTGKFTFQCTRIVGPTCGNPNHPNPTLDKLATGKLELEVKGAQKLPEKKEKEAFTAWGKEINGLQAGLGLRAGEHRAYHHGETVMLVVRVRNVGKETVKFEYIRQFLDEEPPTVTKADGKTVPPVGINMLGFHGPVEVTLEPGKEIELESRMAGGAKLAGAPGIPFGLEPALGTGKVSFQYHRVLGNSSAGSINIDPALKKLATGKLDLEIKEAGKK
jgi:RNA polymerase sigma factor (sigma-70 family)